jgi:protein-S-isoprenylcysteine O-methyltransferase Ste14
MAPPPPSDDRPNRTPWPPIIHVTALVAALTLDRLLPLWPALWNTDLRLPGWLLVAAGLAVACAGFFYFQSIGTPVDPTGRAKVLATGGIYRLTRNPMYLGALIFFAGLALILHSFWLLVALPGIGVALHTLAIAREEAYLTRRFGDAYRDYCKRVRRWI